MIYFYNIVEILILATSSFGEKVAKFFEQSNRHVSSVVGVH